jgi:hypothetical protein
MRLDPSMRRPGALAGATGAWVFESDWNAPENTTFPEISQSPRLAVIVAHRRHELADRRAVLVEIASAEHWAHTLVKGSVILKMMGIEEAVRSTAFNNQWRMQRRCGSIRALTLPGAKRSR